MSGGARPPTRGRPGDDRLDLFKEFWPASFALAHRTSVLVLLGIIVLMGVTAYRGTPKESFPEIEVPFIAVNTMYGGVSPADVESLVTRPLESELATLPDLKQLTSTSVEGYSSIMAEFETSVDLAEALQKVRERVDLARPKLPAEAEDPAIVEFNFSEIPVMQVNLSGEYDLVRLKEIGEDLQDRLEQIRTVLRVDLRGGLDREVKVDVDLRRLQFYNLSLYDVVDAISAENVNIPGGSIDVGTSRYLVRVDGEFPDPALIEELVVKTVEGRPVYVRDVAMVDFGFQERESFARLNGSPVVTLDVIKRSGRNIIETSEEVRRVLAEMQPLFPPGTVVEITSDMSEDIGMMVSSLENNIISGLILIVAVLLFFLGLSNSMFVAVSIPSSMLLSFIVLNLMGVTMNMVVLFSLILALGMLVDNAIVVVENIYRYMEQGWERHLAAAKATGEVAVPVIAATATTLAAFAPLLFWPGIVGEFMGYLPITLIVTLSSSLFVALVILPTLCAMFMRLEGEPRAPLTPAARWTLIGATGLALLAVAGANLLTAVLLVTAAVALLVLYHFVLRHAARRFREQLLPASLRLYERQLRWALDHRVVVLGVSGAVLVASVMLFGRFNAGMEFFPESIPPRQAFIDIETPVGTRASATDELVLRIEDELAAFPDRQDWKSRVAMTGSGGAGGASQMAGQGGPGGPNRGRVVVSFVDYQDRTRPSDQTLAELQASVGRGIAGATISVETAQDGPQQGLPVNIEIVGEEPERLKELSDRVISILERSPVYPKLVGLKSDLDEARPELAIYVDREKASLYDLSTSKIGSTIRAAISGVEAAKFRTGNDEYDIVVRLAEPWRRELEQLRDLTVADDGRQIPLLSVARWEVGEGYGSIKRKDQTRMATIGAGVAEGYNTNAVLAEVQGVLADFVAELPLGYTVRYTGQSQEQDEAMDFLGTAFLTALLLIAFILMSQFNSVVKPVIIMTSVIMSTVGVFLGLVVFRMPFGIIMSMVGIISLAGIVVNNAILLIDYVDILRTRDGLGRREALVLGGKTRFRPVVLTATTTALGLVPLAIGLNFDFFGLFRALEPELFWGGEQAAWWGPMAIVVITGILFATFLTLVLVPVMYSLVDDASDFVKRHYLSAEEEPAGVPEEERVPPAGRADVAGRQRRPQPEVVQAFEPPPALGNPG